MAAPVLSTLHHVTDRKLAKLEVHRTKFEADKAAILANVAAASHPGAKVEALIEGFVNHGFKVRSPDLSFANVARFVHQARRDPSVSNGLLKDWQRKLEHELNVSSAKYEYAALFGKLVIEWIKHPNPAPSASASAPAKDVSDTASETSDTYDHVGRKEMYEQRKEWEEYAFTERKVDQAKIEEYLNELFGTTLQAKKIKKTPLQNLRETLMSNVMDFKRDLKTPLAKDNRPHWDEQDYRFDVEKLKSCIRGVLKLDLLESHKREALADLLNQPAVLGELVDVLNMDLEGLDDWEWDPAPVPLTMRRQLNGKYRVFMDEETHQAILLHFVGETWAVALKTAFGGFYHSGAWLETPFRSMSKKARQRREYFVPHSTHQSHTVRDHRRDMYKKDYFMMQLPDARFTEIRDYDSSGQNEWGSTEKVQSHAETKQSMLRLITTEMLLNTKLYGEFVIVQSDFKWFGPSLPHDTIFAVLKFFGVPGKWLRFFKKFLECPVYFAQDGSDAETHVRKCGIPMSHILSDALSEAVLFCLDFAVNKQTRGANIHRFHDDLWFWGQEQSSVQAWKAIQEFSDVMGLALNQEKTGAALVVADKAKARTLDSALPQGHVKWGFLVLDTEAGRWVIDRKQVDEHIEELRRQLGACRSVMAWVQAWNSYVSRFFPTNFGKPANCFGRQHNDMIIEAFEHIQKSLFSNDKAESATDYLRGVLKERFETNDTVPDGFFYFPVELGGLGLRNPFINAFATYRKSFRDSGERIDRSLEDEQEEYERLKERWDAGEHRAEKSTYYSKLVKGSDSEGDEPFISFEEYMRYNEEVSSQLRNAYTNLLECPPEETVDQTAEFYDELRKSNVTENPYWLWILNLYAGDLKTRFGGQGLQLGERDLLPVGLVDVLKSERVRWEG